jgi:hypothetical protein
LIEASCAHLSAGEIADARVLYAAEALKVRRMISFLLSAKPIACRTLTLSNGGWGAVHEDVLLKFCGNSLVTMLADLA